jgi:membrane-bound lytic murein transglycosylase F
MSKRTGCTFLLGLMLLVFSCRQEPEQQFAVEEEELINPIVANSVNRDYAEIKKEGVLRALIVYSSTSYFLYRGQPMGFEYELLKKLADDLDLELELVISDNLDNQFEVLNRGDVDLIAHGLTITNQRKWEVDFTEDLYLTRQVLVQKKPDNYRKMRWSNIKKHLIEDPVELIGDTVSIRRNSAYWERLESLSNEIGGRIFVDTLDSKFSDGEIIDMVAQGKLKYTIADENLAKINASYQPILDISVPISFTQRIAWVTRKKSKNLKARINEWIKKERKTLDYRVTYNKYFKNKRSFKKRSESDYYSLNNKQISRYDQMIKKHAKDLGWDWRLLASQAYQESKFNPNAKSWAGARGLMQIMPATAMDLEIKDLSDPAESLRGGTAYLKDIYEKFSYIEDTTERQKFTLASYNCGYGHILDAQRLARANDLDPNLWKDNVDKMLLNLSYPKYYNKPMIRYGYVRGSEPVAYVEDIFDRYQHYRAFFD